MADVTGSPSWNPFGDYPSSVDRVPTLSPQQMGLQNQLIGQAGTLSQNLSQNKFDFAPIEQKAREQFQTRTVPSLAARFLGQGNVQNSGAFQGALGSAASDLQTNLAAMGSEYGLKQQELQQGQLRNLLGYGLAPSFENFYTPPQEGLGKQLVSKGGEIAGDLAKEGLKGYLSGKIQMGLQKQQQENDKQQKLADAAGDIAKTGAGVGVGAGAAAAGTSAVGGLTWASALPILGIAAAITAGGFGLYKFAKWASGRIDKKRELKKRLKEFNQYRSTHPQEFPSDFPNRGKKEKIDAYFERIAAYSNEAAKRQGGQ